MHLFKKLIIVIAIGTLLHIQFPHSGFADTKSGKVTQNKPQFQSSAEEFLPGAGSKARKPSG